MTLSKNSKNYSENNHYKELTEYVSIRNEQTALKMIWTSKEVEIQFLESLILAQDERWRRA